ncbi:MAG: NAD(P)H-dependent oxidoreductase subunit E [Candidatus Aminicenantes bacterium]|nr:NAD(P)H-dependent oxidoreductase subunit E [Candidatus Aminicenantes bacterium]
MTNIETIIQRHAGDPTRLLDMLRDVQAARGCVDRVSRAALAKALRMSEADVEGIVSFYHFFSRTPAGRYAVYLNTNVIAWMNGRAAVARAFEREAGVRFGRTAPDGLIGLFQTSCIGMNDQEPSAVINGVVFTRLTEAKVKDIVAGMRAGRPAAELVGELGDGANQHALVRAMVANNIRAAGPVVFGPHEPGRGLRKAVGLTPEAVIAEVKASNLLGRGGAGFPTGLKWDFCRREKGDRHYVVCNADEGEPGTFKDRVILTERPGLLFEGMAVAGYAVGAAEGILYLRAEYAYLKPYLESVLDGLRREGLLGKGAAGKAGFDFDIVIKLGAGAYICGEESALIESAEGKRGEPRDRPPFPVQVGYLNEPTIVNNVETLCCAARIMAEGAAWFKSMGTAKSAGTKLLSVSGDCERPGVYEVAFGLTVRQLLDMAGAPGAAAVQVGGPSGSCIGPDGFKRAICFGDLPTGGSIMIFGPERDLLEVVRGFMEFFVEESCGWCVPCRAGNVLLLRKLEKVLDGKGNARDLEELVAWGAVVKTTSRCGLGQTSANPILTTLANFRGLYEARLRSGADADAVLDFDLAAAMEASCRAAGRPIPSPEAHHG